MAILAILLELLGPDIPCGSIGPKEMSEFELTIRKLPPNLNKNPEYGDKSLMDILKLNPTKTISPSTANKWIIRCSSLFKFAMAQGLMTSNPASGRTSKKTIKSSEERDRFELSELKAIFESPKFKSINRPSRYCAPIIGLYSGMRLNEICQLRVLESFMGLSPVLMIVCFATTTSTQDRP